MKTNTFFPLILLVFSMILISCRTSSQQNNVSTQPTSQTSPSPTTSQMLKAEQVLNAFKSANLPMSDIVIYTDETDPNKLLNRPNQYVEKVGWSDSRVKQVDETKYTDSKVNNPEGGTFEVFLNNDDLDRRKTYIETVTKNYPPATQYIYVHKNVLLRLEHSITPKQAKEYETALKSL